MKMEKTPRYTQRERNMVLGFAAQYKDVIENKRTDAESNRKKDDVWRTIAKEFNCRVYHQRSSKQLRQLYKNMKLLLKKDLCSSGDDKIGNNRSFMDILSALSQQDSVGQYIANINLSPSGYSSRNQSKFDDDYEANSKLASAAYNAVDNDVIVIKSEDISDNEQSSQNGGGNHGNRGGGVNGDVGGCGRGSPEDMDDDDDDDDDDCLSAKDIPEVCLEEEDDEIFTGLRQPSDLMLQSIGIGSMNPGGIGSMHPAGIGSINPINGSIGSMNAASSVPIVGGGLGNRIAHNHHHQTTNNFNSNHNNMGNSHRGRGNSGSGGGITTNTNNNNSSNPSTNHHHHHHHLNGKGHDHLSHLLSNLNAQPAMMTTTTTGSSGDGSDNTKNEYLLTLAIEERKRKIDLLNAQIDYWKTLTKKLESNSSHNPSPSCPCHFPKVNGVQQHQS